MLEIFKILKINFCNNIFEKLFKVLKFVCDYFNCPTSVNETSYLNNLKLNKLRKNAITMYNFMPQK